MNLIIGGTHGLGLEIAKIYRQKGEDVFVTGRSYDEAKHGQGLAVDLALKGDAEKLIQRIQDEVINRFLWVAGYGYVGDFTRQPDPRMMAEVNFTNVLPIAQRAWQKQVESGAASNFVVVSSTTGFTPRKDEAVYAGTKHAQVGFARSLGLESERLDSNIKVALFMPGGMQTPFWEGNKPSKYNDFLDPSKVAAIIVHGVDDQRDYFYEEVINR